LCLLLGAGAFRLVGRTVPEPVPDATEDEQSQDGSGEASEVVVSPLPDGGAGEQPQPDPVVVVDPPAVVVDPPVVDDDGELTCEKNKILICHYPPDNLANFHEICISESSEADHLAAGDKAGICEND